MRAARAAAWVLAACLLMAGAGPAWAHGYVVRAIPAEAVAALLVVGAAALLSATPVPTPILPPAPPPPSVTVAGYTVPPTITPGGRGVNACELGLASAQAGGEETARGDIVNALRTFTPRAAS